MFRKLFLILVFFVFALPVQAGDLPKGVKPEQGRASGIYEIWGKYNITISFWNVGEMGGGDYGKASLDSNCVEKTTSDGWICVEEDKPSIGIFSGGPNGKITFEGETNKLNLHLVDGKYFEMTMGKTVQIPVENPEIFSKYNWDESSNTDEGKSVESKLEDSGTGISDLSGQVEVNIPNGDGTYDEENWQFAKLDGRSFPVGTHIKTSENSSAIISFADMTVFKMKPDTEIVVSSSAAAKDSQIRLLVGNLWTNVKKMAKDGTMEIEASQAVAGIKGTTFVLEGTKETSTLKVIEGSVAFKSKASGKKEIVNSGETITADKNGLGQKTTFDPVVEEKKWQEFDKGNKNIIYILGGILTLAIIGFLLLKSRRHNK